MDKFTRRLTRLCEVSQRRSVNPYTALAWPEVLDREQWYTSPELISLYGTEVYERLNEPARQRLSFYEAVNFFSLNLHGERFLIQGLAQRLYRHDTSDISSYLHHFLDEENKHMVYFGRFCLQYASKVYPDRTLGFPRDYAPGEEDVLFFTRVLIFEEIVDAYNLSMANDARLVPIVRQINAMHHREETRHLPVEGNYFLAQYLTGQYRSVSEAPAYLCPEHYETIRQRLDAITVVTADAKQWLAEQASESIDCFSLSNICEVMSLGDTAKTFAEVVRVARQGGRICFRNLIIPRTVPEHLQTQIVRDASLSERLLRHDRSFIYARVDALRVIK